MSGEFVCTIGDVSNIPELIQGPFLKGRRNPRVAMIGRSNVGKSSLINALLEARMAQVSKQPGKTRAIHFYFWKESGRIIADLPGYGYARAAHAERDRWKVFINAYLGEDPGLEAALVLLDARHGPTDLDREAISFLNLKRIPVVFVMTKADSLKNQSERARRKKEVVQALEEMGFDASGVHWVSSKTRDGIKGLAKAFFTEAQNTL